MRGKIFVVSLLACMGAASGAALAQSPWYITGSAGAYWRSDASRSTTFTNGFGATSPGTNTTTYDPGPVINLGLGYKLPSGFRVEAELGYAHYSSSSVSTLSTNGVFPSLTGTRLTTSSGSGHDNWSATANAFY